MSEVCYILASTVCNKTYAGCTEDLKIRIQQHNGLRPGGAKYTTTGRPWKVVCYISGFPDRKTALQFEWRMHHPNAKAGKRGKYKGRGLADRWKLLNKVMRVDKFTSTCISNYELQLTVNWLIPDPPALQLLHHQQVRKETG